MGAVDQPHGVIALPAGHGEVRSVSVLNDETVETRQLRRAPVDQRHVDDGPVVDPCADS